MCCQCPPYKYLYYKQISHRHDVLGYKKDVDSIATNLRHAEEDVDQAPDMHRLGCPASACRLEGSLEGTNIIELFK